MKNLLFSILITFFTITSHCSLRLPNLETFDYNAEGDLILTSQKELNPDIYRQTKELEEFNKRIVQLHIDNQEGYFLISGCVDEHGFFKSVSCQSTIDLQVLNTRDSLSGMLNRRTIMHLKIIINNEAMYNLVLSIILGQQKGCLLRTKTVQTNEFHTLCVLH